MLPKNCKSIPENWLELQILALLKCRMGFDRFGLYNKNGEQVCVCRFIKEYFSEKASNLNRYFSRPDSDTLYSKVFGDIIPITTTVEEGCKKLSNEVRFDNLDISGFGPYLSMAIKETYQIEDFFNGFGMSMFEPENSLEQSPCRPIIGSKCDEIHGDITDKDGNVIDRSSYINTVYYCKLHPEFTSPFLNAIESHCRENEPDIHRAEISRVHE